MQVHIAKVTNLFLHAHPEDIVTALKVHPEGIITAGVDVLAKARAEAALTDRRVKLDGQGNALPWSATSWAAMEDHAAGLVIDLRCLHRGNHESCMRYAAESTFLGRSWSLGSVDFYFNRVADRTRQNPAVSPDLYPMLRSEWVWSKTPDAAPEDPASPVYAWGVNLGRGNAGFVNRHYDGLALPVSPLAAPSGQ